MKRKPHRAGLAWLLLLAAAPLAAAQTSPGEPAAAQGAPPARATTTARAARATADEDFELNIAERRITESDFEASTEVEAGAEGGLSLRVGVMVRAAEIDVLLRNVRGRVRFRATLEPVLQLIRRQGPAARAPAAQNESSPP